MLPFLTYLRQIQVHKFHRRTDIKPQIGQHSFIDDFNTQLSPINGSSRKKNYKQQQKNELARKTLALNDIINQIDLQNIPPPPKH